MRFYDDRPKVENKTTVRGIGFSGLLTVAFIVLKLCGVIDWSWAWVLSPIWISAIIGLVALITFIIFVIWLNDD
jgi:Flp pilus assembly protein TadB